MFLLYIVHADLTADSLSANAMNGIAAKASWMWVIIHVPEVKISKRRMCTFEIPKTYKAAGRVI